MSKPKQPTDNSSDQFAVRNEKLAKLRSEGLDPFRNNWEQTHTSKSAVAQFDEALAEDEPQTRVSVAGRIVTFRVMGKASFVRSSIAMASSNFM